MPVPLFAAGEKPSAAKLQQLANEDTYTPTLTASTSNPTLGTGAQQFSRIWLNGQHVTIWAYVRFGTSASAGSGTYRLSIPAAYPLDPNFNNFPVGSVRLLDNSTSNQESGTLVADIDTGTFLIQHDNDGDFVSNSNPWTWADLDNILFIASYLTDFGSS